MDLAAFTGMPTGKKKTRRGKRRRANPSEHQQHLAEMKRCADCHDRKGARTAAFKFVQSMRDDDDEPEMEHAVADIPAKATVRPPEKPASGLSPALRAYLGRGKKSP